MIALHGLHGEGAQVARPRLLKEGTRADVTIFE
jgi:hypothetical protein